MIGAKVQTKTRVVYSIRSSPLGRLAYLGGGPNRADAGGPNLGIGPRGRAPSPPDVPGGPNRLTGAGAAARGRRPRSSGPRKGSEASLARSAAASAASRSRMAARAGASEPH